MRSALCRVLVRVAARRLRPVLVTNPLLGAIAGAAVVGTPVAAWLIGGELGRQIGPAAVGPVADMLALSSAFVGVIAGALFATLAPGRAALGAQLRSAPLSRPDEFIVLTLLPAALLAVPVAFTLALGAASFSRHLPGGTVTAMPLLASGAYAAAVGAALSQAVVALRRRAADGLLAVLLIGGIWTFGGVLAGHSRFARRAATRRRRDRR